MKERRVRMVVGVTIYRTAEWREDGGEWKESDTNVTAEEVVAERVVAWLRVSVEESRIAMVEHWPGTEGSLRGLADKLYEDGLEHERNIGGIKP